MTLSFDAAAHADAMAVLTRAVAAITAELDELETSVASLRSQWSGSAQDAYDTGQRQWSASMQRLNTALANATTAAQVAVSRVK